MIDVLAAAALVAVRDNPLQRFMRDTHAGSMQIVANWDEQAEAYGASGWGWSRTARCGEAPIVDLSIPLSDDVPPIRRT